MSPADRIAALEAEVAELRAYLPMLSRLAFFEKFAGSVPDTLLALEDWAHYETVEGCVPAHSHGPEFTRPKDEPLPVAAQALQDAYTRRTAPWVVAS